MSRRLSPACGALALALASACTDKIATAPEITTTGPRLDVSAAADPVSFCNPATITLNQAGAATPYPSLVTVSGIPSGPFKVTATLNGFSHTAIGDVDMALVGPGGQNVMLMSDAGSGSDFQNATVTFDDAATAQLPASGSSVLPSGTYRPVNFGTGDFFQGLAGPFGESLTVFGGTDPNGTWKLYIWDDVTFFGGSIANGWCVNITALSSVPVANAGGPYTGNERVPITLDGTGSTDAGDDIVSYLWDFGDGQTGSGATVQHTYALLGTYTVKLRVIDAEGAVSDAATTATISALDLIGFCNPAPITVRDANSAVPFPSTIAVSGLSAGSFKVTATVRHITHSFLGDLDILLVGPGGQSVMLMSDAASVVNQFRDLRLTFDDDASAVIQQGLPDLQSGTYKPTNYGLDDPIPAGGPAGPYGSSFAVFAGTNPNGVWKLYIWDDVLSFVKPINGGWCLNITSLNSAPVADAGGPYSGSEGSPITLDASASTDPDDNITSYAWNFGDGETGSGLTVEHTYANGGTYTVTLLVTDADGVTDEATTMANIAHVAPTATFNAPAGVNEGDAAAISLTSPSAGDARYAFDCGSGYGEIGAVSTAACATADNGTLMVRAKVIDATIDEMFSEYSADINVANVAPTATFANNGPVAEGSSFHLQFANPVDVAADLAGLVYAFDCGSGYAPPGGSSSATCSTTDNGNVHVRGKVFDKDGGETEYTATVNVTNVPPVVTSLALPSGPVAVNAPITLGATFTDAGPGDTHTGSFELGAGGPIASGSIVEANGSGSMSTSVSFAQAGVYTIIARVTDDDGATGSRSSAADIPAYLVVYDPTGSFVTGGGWISSPAGAYAANPTFTGKASFGFVAKYLPGANTPSGNTEFQFKAGDLNFKSTSYDWLVVAAAHAKYKGEGTINGGGSYGFMLTAVDGELPGGGGEDAFRIKIWELASGAIVYDNKMGEGDDADAATALGGGSIVIHR